MRAPRGLFLTLLLALFVTRDAGAKDLPNFDALASKPPSARAALTSRSAAERERPGTSVHMEDRLGVPSFLWIEPGSRDGQRPLAAGAGPEEAAKHHLLDYLSLYGLTDADVAAATVSNVHDTGTGVIVVSLRRSFDGVEVFRDELRVAMNRRLEPLAFSGYLPPATLPADAAGFRLSAPEAVARALCDFEDSEPDALRLSRVGDASGGYVLVDRVLAGNDNPARPGLLQPARAKKVFFHLPQKLEPAYYIEVNVGSPVSCDSDAYSYVVSAVDGQLLFRRNLTASDSFSYRVWADTTPLAAPLDGPQGNAPTPNPTGLVDGYQAPFVAPGLVTLEHGPISTGDPWLPAGATQTIGNNVEAYADLVAPDGFGPGDIHADVTAPGAFDRTYDTAKSPDVSLEQRKAAIAQLFYDVNFFHDWYYDVGFDEKSGNAQASNYGRGGLENDSLKAEAQDYSGRNNANMMTPADGARPRMQMYIWDGNPPLGLTVNTPASIARSYAIGIATFGASSFDLTGDLVLVDDGFGVRSDGCDGPPFANGAAVSGKIALVDRGNCPFIQKAVNAQAAGAIGLVIANNVPGLINVGYSEPAPNPLPTIPTVVISLEDAGVIKPQLGSVNLRLLRGPVPDRDGTIDNQIVAHEWGHYISNRLIANSAGLGTNMAGGLGEGWADFHAMLLTVKPEDASVPSNTGFRGVYALTGYVASGGGNGPFVNTGYYFGVRRVPYSIDFTKDPLTFGHIANGTPLPTTAPVAFGADGADNAEVHNTGEVWCTMLWECYASLLTDTARLSFDAARERMRRYIVAAYKITPSSPTLLEARDALLVTALAFDPADYFLFARAFARRGAGIGAVAPDRYSETNQGGVESFTATGNELAFVSAALDDDVLSCDRDGVLDSGETATLTLTLKNVGTGALVATTATVSSSHPSVSFPAGATVSFPASQPFQAIRASLPVALGPVSGFQVLDFRAAFRDAAPTVSGEKAVTWSVRANTTDILGQSATDDVESSSTRWTPGHDAALDVTAPWQRVEIGPLDHRWAARSAPGLSDQYLVSPPLAVAATGNFGFTFRSRFSFETQLTPRIYWDGGVLEISTDGGVTWTDIGASATPGYTGVLTTTTNNPLGDRRAFCGDSPGYPAQTTVTVALGTAYQGKTVRVRFRIGSDEGTGSAGWEIDDIAFTNITNAPFAALVAHAPCVPKGPPFPPSRLAPALGASGTPLKKP